MPGFGNSFYGPQLPSIASQRAANPEFYRTNGSRSFSAGYDRRSDGSYGSTLNVTDNHSRQSWRYDDLDNNGRFENTTTRVSASQARWLRSQGVPFNADGSVDSYLISQSTARLDNQDVTIFNVGGKRMAQRPDGTQLIDQGGDGVGFRPVGMPEATARYLKSKGISPSSVKYDTKSLILNGKPVQSIVAGDRKIAIQPDGKRFISYKGSDYIAEPKGSYKLVSTSLTFQQGKPAVAGLLILGQGGSRQFIPKNPALPVMVNAVLNGKQVYITTEQANASKKEQALRKAAADTIRAQEQQAVAAEQQQNGLMRDPLDTLWRGTVTLGKDLLGATQYTLQHPLDTVASVGKSLLYDAPVAAITGSQQAGRELRARVDTVQNGTPVYAISMEETLRERGVDTSNPGVGLSGLIGRVFGGIVTEPLSIVPDFRSPDYASTLRGQSERIYNQFNSQTPKEYQARQLASLGDAYAIGAGVVVPGGAGDVVSGLLSAGSMAVNPDPSVNNAFNIAQNLALSAAASRLGNHSHEHLAAHPKIEEKRISAPKVEAGSTAPKPNLAGKPVSFIDRKLQDLAKWIGQTQRNSDPLMLRSDAGAIQLPSQSNGKKRPASSQQSGSIGREQPKFKREMVVPESPSTPRTDPIFEILTDQTGKGTHGVEFSIPGHEGGAQLTQFMNRLVKALGEANNTIKTQLKEIPGFKLDLTEGYETLKPGQPFRLGIAFKSDLSNEARKILTTAIHKSTDLNIPLPSKDKLKTSTMSAYHNPLEEQAPKVKPTQKTATTISDLTSVLNRKLYLSHDEKERLVYLLFDGVNGTTRTSRKKFLKKLEVGTVEASSQSVTRNISSALNNLKQQKLTKPEMEMIQNFLKTPKSAEDVISSIHNNADKTHVFSINLGNKEASKTEIIDLLMSYGLAKKDAKYTLASYNTGMDNIRISKTKNNQIFITFDCPAKDEKYGKMTFSVFYNSNGEMVYRSKIAYKPDLKTIDHVHYHKLMGMDLDELRIQRNNQKES